jgi:ribosome-associated protein
MQTEAQNSESLTRLVLDALDDLKATDVRVLDVRQLTDVTDYMVVATGRSARQVSALAEHVQMVAKQRGVTPIGVEGLREGDWALVDLCDVVVHVMQPETRDTYQLEKLWAPPDANAVQVEGAPQA